MPEVVNVGVASPEPLSGVELVEIGSSSVFRLSVEVAGQRVGHGTAFAYKQVINEDASGSRLYLVTNLHNFRGALQQWQLVLALAASGLEGAALRPSVVVDVDGVPYEVTSVIAVKGAMFREFQHFEDFVICSIDISDPTPRRLFAVPNGRVRAGEQVFALGFPKDTSLGITEGIVSHVYGVDAPVESFQWQVQHSILINPGNSGGPTVDSSGTAIGISTWGRTDLDGINFSVDLMHSFEICRDPSLIETVSISKIFDRYVERAREEVRFGH